MSEAMTRPVDGAKLLEAKARLKAEGLTDYGIACAFRTAPDGTFCHAYLYDDGQWRFQTGGNPIEDRRGGLIHCVYTMALTPLARALSPQPGDDHDR